VSLFFIRIRLWVDCRSATFLVKPILRDSRRALCADLCVEENVDSVSENWAPCIVLRGPYQLFGRRLAVRTAPRSFKLVGL
jgi:hypothetical protein